MPPKLPLWDQGPHPLPPPPRGWSAIGSQCDLSPGLALARGRVTLFNIKPFLGASACNERLGWGYLPPCFNGGQLQGAVPLLALTSSRCPAQLPHALSVPRTSPQHFSASEELNFLFPGKLTPRRSLFTPHSRHMKSMSPVLILETRETRHRQLRSVPSAQVKEPG